MRDLILRNRILIHQSLLGLYNPSFVVELHCTKKEARRSKSADSSLYDYQVIFDTLDVFGLHVAMGKALKKLERMGYAS